VLRTDLSDYRRSSDRELLAGLRERDPLALAEAYHRTIPAAHACARRMLSGSTEVEALLRAVYGELWEQPPTDGALEGWIRSRCFALGGEHLRARGSSPATPSLSELLPDLPATEPRYLDAAERAVSELTPEERRALLRAHDAGLPTHEHGDPDAVNALERALVKLAGPEGDASDNGCTDLESLGDWALGLVSGELADAISSQVSARPECAERVRMLRRGRRRLEGLPPTPDMGQRILVTVLAGGPPPAAAAAPAAQPAPPPAAPPPAIPADEVEAAAEEPDAGDDLDETGAFDTLAGEPTLSSSLDSDLDTAGDDRLSDVLANGEDQPASALGPYEELAALDDDQHEDAGDLDLSDEDSGDLLPEYDEDIEDGKRSLGARALRIFGYLVLLALGALVGLYVGSWFVAR
jgi:DNA-directed RNA polymerase specialized sigma24 family protein